MTELEYRKHECKVCSNYIKKDDNLGLCVSCNYKYNFKKLQKDFSKLCPSEFRMKILPIKWITERANNHWEETIRIGLILKCV